MVCRPARWMISKAEDSGTRPPRWVERHTARCGACLDYARFTGALRARLSGERPAFLAAAPEFSLGEAGRGRAERRPERQPALVRRLTLRPVPAAAAALVVVAAALVLFRVVLREAPPSSEDRTRVLAALKSYVTATEGLPVAVREAESSLAREREILERSLAKGAEYLQARLNIRIERRNAPKPF